MVLCRWQSKECRICDVAMGVTRANVRSVTYGKGDLLCPLALEWRASAPMLQRDAQYACCDDVSACLGL